MGLFTSLKKIALTTAHEMLQDIEYVNKNHINSKLDTFLLEYSNLMKQAYNKDDKMKIISALVFIGVITAKSDGDFSKEEILELADFFQASTDNEISGDEALEMIQVFYDAPVNMEELAQMAINLSRIYGSSAINTLRSFIEYIIYSDGKVHEKELNFLRNWEHAVEIKQRGY